MYSFAPVFFNLLFKIGDFLYSFFVGGWYELTVCSNMADFCNVLHHKSKGCVLRCKNCVSKSSSEHEMPDPS